MTSGQLWEGREGLAGCSMGQDARAEEENAKRPNSWRPRQLRLEARLAELLRPPVGPVACGLLFDGGVRCRGSGTEWLQRQRLASQFDHSQRILVLV
jgi:hypothetical protein